MGFKSLEPFLAFSASPQKFSQNASIGIRSRIVLATVLALFGLSAIAIGQETPMPESAATNQTAVEGVVIYPRPPAGFDPLTASNNELKRYGFPPRPDAQKAPQAYRHWRALVSVPRIGNPTLQQTDIYDGPAKLAPGKRTP
jgi:hypothetical protein